VAKKKVKFAYWPQAILALAALTTVFCALYFLNKGRSSDDVLSTEQPQSPSLPGLSLIDFQNKELALKDMLSGDKNLLIFWATWCGPCVDEMKKMPELLPKLKQKGYSTIFLNYDPPEKRKIAAIFAQKNGITTAFDAKGDILYNLGLSALPVTLLVDKSGKILKTFQGELNESKL